VTAAQDTGQANGSFLRWTRGDVNFTYYVSFRYSFQGLQKEINFESY
jgi:hypothetical protein